MELTLRPYTEDLEPAVRAFNQRLMGGGLAPELTYPENHLPGWTKQAGSHIYQERYLLTEDGSVRGGFMLTHEEWQLNGKPLSVAHYRLPISEGIIDPMYKPVASELTEKALHRQPKLYVLGMGGQQGPAAKHVRRKGWPLIDVPFFFRIERPQRFLREFAHLRRQPKFRVAMDLAAATGLGMLAINGYQTLRSFSRQQPEAVSEVVPQFGDWADSVWEQSMREYLFLGPRNAGTLNARFEPEEARYLRLRVVADGVVKGWALLLDTRMENNKYFGNLRVGTIVDGLCRPSDAGFVVGAAARFLASAGVDLIVTNQSHAAWRKALESHGFLEGPSNCTLGLSPDLAGNVEPLSVTLSQMHLTRGDGPGPTRLM